MKRDGKQARAEEKKRARKTAEKARALVKAWWPSALTTGAVLWLTLAPDPTPDLEMGSLLGEYGDKAVHAIMTGGMTGAIVFDYKRRGVRREKGVWKGKALRLSRRAALRIGIFMTLFALADEAAQEAMGMGRSGEWGDFAADMAGLAVGLATATAATDKLMSALTKKGKKQ